jgi:DNA invertase Pin-like site-specific DNA recombinase
LVEILIDDGFSASKGHHISKGKFGSVFLANLAKYKGYVLIVEDLDRLDRRGIEETRELLAQILRARIEIHVTQENRVIRDTNDFISALLNLVQSHGAADYSRKLSQRIGKAWALRWDATRRANKANRGQAGISKDKGNMRTRSSARI